MKLCPVCQRTWEDEFRVCPIDGLVLQAAAADSDSHIGQTVGHARVGQKIADGSQGPVYHAEDPVLGAVAVQFVSAERLASPVLIEAFEAAVKLTAKVNHPNVVSVYCSKRTSDGGVAVLMEYLAGTSLEVYSREHPHLDIQQCLRIVKGAAEGVLAAHRVSLLHGSLHPSRILMASDGSVKVCGFHRAGLRDDVFESTNAPGGVGYLAPERTGILHDIPVPDYRADVYSLGAILYELLAGKLPYEAKSIQEMGAAMASGPPLPVSFSNPQVSATLSRVILKALSQQPSARQASMENFIRELEAGRQPIREPERDAPGDRHPRLPNADAGEGSGLFSPSSNKESAESLWPKTPEGKLSGEESRFSWFKTRGTSGPGSTESGRKHASPDDSNILRKGTSTSDDDDGNERTVVVSSRRGGGRRRSFLGTLTNLGRDENDLTGTDALPHRRFSGKEYLLMGLVGLALLIGPILAFWFFGAASTGRLTVETDPPGAKVYLNEEFRGNTPLPIGELKASVYRLRLQLDGYEDFAANVTIGPKADVLRAYPLTKVVPVFPPPPPVIPPSDIPPQLSPKATTFEGKFSEALRSRNFFPPGTANAWDILQAWRQKEGPTAAAVLEESQQRFCSEVEKFGADKLAQKDFQFVRGLLDQIRARMPGQACGGGLQAQFDGAITRSLSDLQISLHAAMDRQNYVTPESDNALKYARLILHIDPQHAEAKSLENDIYTRALAQARAKSDARDHQEALNIYLQLKSYYPNAPGGPDALNQAIGREREKFALIIPLRVPSRVQVKHGHSRFRLTNRECTGLLIADGFVIEYQSSGDHSVKVSYDLLKSVSFSNGKIVLESSAIPDGKIELEQADKNPNPTLEEVYTKIQENRKLREQYLRLKLTDPGV